MNFYKIFIISSLTTLTVGCNGKQNSTKNLFSLVINQGETKIQEGNTVEITIKNRKNTPIDSVTYSLNDVPVTVGDGKFKIDTEKLGDHTLYANVYHEGEVSEISETITVLANNPPKIYSYTILNEFPHDIKAYTQGLEFHDGQLYESTGRRGQSTLRKVNFETGEVEKKIDLDDIYFGEGITIINNKIFQLTWQKRTGFIYDLDSFEKTGSFQYNQSKEGWGLTNDGDHIYKSDGTDKIWILDPETLQEKDFIQTVTNSSVFNKANELEFVDGLIYANVYLKDSAMIIDAKTGAIIGVIDFRGLKNKVTQHADLDVLNGIAYHPERKTFFITGKNWDKMFEVQIHEK
ncbi:glutaminyl-peptide cyclotransferase [Robertkochia solimangrovi]|uniref:glutaminyl-peptide cyclotransferase n=1 Tax=Robertkochia solimangrovi TaxID=2213046 RepID=UPI00117EB3BF|nr:glutaminyl-peptide cyclotransferase [Robertkochia solimangrovi]TRZ45181.1 glutaminyl-peptide cyclotransferase [Robertkochia solimangrovi]